jgi:hypothetical protein
VCDLIKTVHTPTDKQDSSSSSSKLFFYQEKVTVQADDHFYPSNISLTCRREEKNEHTKRKKYHQKESS